MFTINKKAKNFSIALMSIGIIAVIFGFVTDAHGTWPALLFNTYFYLGISVFAVFFCCHAICSRSRLVYCA